MTAGDGCSARVRRSIVAGVATALLVVGGSPVAAGGWWSTPRLEDGSAAMAVGETTTVSATVLFDSTSAAVSAAGTGGFYAFLVRGIDTAALQAAMAGPEPERWWTRPDEAIQLGPLSFGPNDANLGSARASFVVPHVPSGLYDVMFCDADCSEPLADVVPLRSVYVGDPLAVGLLRESRLAADHLAAEMTRADEALGDVDAGLRRLEDAVDGLDARVDENATAVEALTTATFAARGAQGATTSGPTGWDALWAGGGWFVAGAALAVAWSHRRRTEMEGDGRTSLDEDDDLGVEDGTTDLPAPEFVSSS